MYVTACFTFPNCLLYHKVERYLFIFSSLNQYTHIYVHTYVFTYTHTHAITVTALNLLFTKVQSPNSSFLPPPLLIGGVFGEFVSLFIFIYTYTGFVYVHMHIHTYITMLQSASECLRIHSCPVVKIARSQGKMHSFMNRKQYLQVCIYPFRTSLP